MDAQVQEQVAAMRRNMIAPKSRAVYRASTVQFLCWLYNNRSDLLTPEFVEMLAPLVNRGSLEAAVSKVITEQSQVHPICFDVLTAEDFMGWLVVLKKNGGAISYATYNSHRSALFNLFRDHGYTMTANLQSELANHFRGLKRTVAAAMAAGDVSCKEGKDPLPFELYVKLGQLMLKSPSRDMIFGRTFLVLSWNLMSRASNTLSICYEHMQFRDDALCIYFAQMKTDQFADRPKDPRHVYANPLKPEICPIFALGIMWLCYGFESGINRLFPGSRQYERFRHHFGRVLDEHHDELDMRGITKDELGSHSIRKGSATYCSSGSTSCPPEAAIDLRAGWAQAGVKGRYVKHQKAGDMYVGRTVSGLPINDEKFTILPPHFTRPDANEVHEAVAICFPKLPFQLNGVVRYALASVVYHSKYLLRTVPQNHPLLASALFTTANLLFCLVPMVCCDLPSDSSRIAATGIPPHVSLTHSIATIREEMRDLSQAQHQSTEEIVKGVVQAMDQRGLATDIVTKSQLRQTIDENNERLVQMISESVDGRHARRQNDEHDVRLDTGIARGGLHMWGGKLHSVPSDFEFPRVGVRDAWLLWTTGDSLRGYPPFRLLSFDDMPTKNKRKRMSDLRFLMQKIEILARDSGANLHDISASEAVELFERFFECG